MFLRPACPDLETMLNFTIVPGPQGLIVRFLQILHIEHQVAVNNYKSSALRIDD